VGYFERVGGEGSEDIGGGVGGDIFLETCGEWFVENVFDGKGAGGGIGDRVGRGKVVEEAEVGVVGVELSEE
jgi:hypothetical protein